MAGRPLAPAGLGENQVPEASITASARSNSGSLAVLVADLEGRRLAARRSSPCRSRRGRRWSTRAAGADVVLERRARRQRLEILRHQLAAGRIVVGIGAVPAGRRSRRSAALSMLYPRARTCAHGPIGAPHGRPVGPASSTTAPCRARAHARRRRGPTGPAPMMATVFVELALHVIASFSESSKYRTKNFTPPLGRLLDRRRSRPRRSIPRPGSRARPRISW